MYFPIKIWRRKSRTMNFPPKSYALIWDFQNISEIKFFYPNLRLRVCLAMSLIFRQSEPSVLINRVLTEKKCVIIDAVLGLTMTLLIKVRPPSRGWTSPRGGSSSTSSTTCVASSSRILPKSTRMRRLSLSSTPSKIFWTRSNYGRSRKP